MSRRVTVASSTAYATNAALLNEKERRLIAIAELLPRKLTFRALAEALEAEYPDITPVVHTTVARDVNVLVTRFQAEAKKIAGHALMGDLLTLDDDERQINQVIVKMLGELLPEKAGDLPSHQAIDRYVKLLERKRKIMEHRCKLLGLESLPEDERERVGAGALQLSDQERVDGVMELLERARTRRDAQDAPSLPN